MSCDQSCDHPSLETVTSTAGENNSSSNTSNRRSNSNSNNTGSTSVSSSPRQSTDAVSLRNDQPRSMALRAHQRHRPLAKKPIKINNAEHQERRPRRPGTMSPEVATAHLQRSLQHICISATPEASVGTMSAELTK